MYEFKTELLESSFKWGPNDSASLKDFEKLDEFLQKKQGEGWKLITYSYMANAWRVKSSFAITFKRKNNE